MAQFSHIWISRPQYRIFDYTCSEQFSINKRELMKTINNLAVILITFSASSFAIASDETFGKNNNALFEVKSGICHSEDSSYYAKNSVAEKNKITSLYKCVISSSGRIDGRSSIKYPSLQALINERELQIKWQDLKSEDDADRRESLLADISVLQTVIKHDEESAKIKKMEIDVDAENKQDFLGFSWGPAIAAMYYGSDTYITPQDIRIDTIGEGANQINTVYIDREVKTNLALLLETHYLYDFNISDVDRQLGLGPFFAINIAKQQGDPLTTFALGVMIAAKDKKGANGISFGIGLFVDTDVTELRDRISDGSTTSFTDSSKLVRKVDESGVLLMISATF